MRLTEWMVDSGTFYLCESVGLGLRLGLGRK